MVGCRFSDKALVFKTNHKLCTKQKKTPHLLTCPNRSFISEAEGIILSLHGLQASSQPFPKGNAVQVERARRRATNRSEV